VTRPSDLREVCHARFGRDFSFLSVVFQIPAAEMPSKSSRRIIGGTNRWRTSSLTIELSESLHRFVSRADSQSINRENSGMVRHRSRTSSAARASGNSEGGQTGSNPIREGRDSFQEYGDARDRIARAFTRLPPLHPSLAGGVVKFSAGKSRCSMLSSSRRRSCQQV